MIIDFLRKLISPFFSKEAPDLSPFVIDNIRYYGETFKVKAPYGLCAPLRYQGDYFLLEIEPVGIYAYAKTRRQLAVEVGEQLSMLWAEYALAEDACLDEGH